MTFGLLLPRRLFRQKLREPRFRALEELHILLPRFRRHRNPAVRGEARRRPRLAACELAAVRREIRLDELFLARELRRGARTRFVLPHVRDNPDELALHRLALFVLSECELYLSVGIRETRAVALAKRNIRSAERPHLARFLVFHLDLVALLGIGIHPLQDALFPVSRRLALEQPQDALPQHLLRLRVVQLVLRVIHEAADGDIFQINLHLIWC